MSINEDDLLKTFLSNSLSNDESAADDHLKLFDRLCVGFFVKYILSSLPTEEATEVRNTIYTQWLSQVNADKPSSKISESIFGEFFGVTGLTGNFEKSFKRADDYVKSVLDIEEIAETVDETKEDPNEPISKNQSE
jgi:hypothetical protein